MQGGPREPPEPPPPRSRLQAPGSSLSPGNMFPTIGDVHLAPFTDEQLYMEQFTKANFW